jgi:hypothetical protein
LAKDSIPIPEPSKLLLKIFDETYELAANIDIGIQNLKERMMELNERMNLEGFLDKDRKAMFNDCFKPIMSRSWFYECLPDDLKRSYTKKPSETKQLELPAEVQALVKLEPTKPSGICRFTTTVTRGIEAGTRIGITFNFDTMSIEGVDFDSTIATGAA